MPDQLTKLTIKGPKGEFAVRLNPDSLHFNRSVEYDDDKVLNSPASVVKYKAHKPTTLNFDFILDATGVAYPITDSIDKMIRELEKVACQMDGDLHKPGELTISWGRFLFKCYLESLKYDFTLFSPSGEPLRVKVSASFSNTIKREDALKEANLKSPDLSRIIILKAGESIPFWCQQIYGDASYCTAIARYNKLSGFRDLPPGTRLIFPPLSRNTPDTIK